MGYTLPLLLALVAQAQPGSGQISGQVVAVGGQGRLTLNLTSAHVRGGERAQIVRQTTTGGWVRAAIGDIAEVTPVGSTLVVTRYEPNMAAAVVGDYVVVTPAPEPTSGYPGFGGRPASAVPTAPTEGAYGAGTEPVVVKKIGDELAVSFGLKYMATFSGKSEPTGAPAGESGKAGFGWSVGPALELRAWKYLALETGFGFYRNTLSKKTTLFRQANTTCESQFAQQDITSNSFAVPLLIKGVLPLEFEDDIGMRLSVGTGIQWLFGRDSKLDVSYTSRDGTDKICPVATMGDPPVRPVDQRFFVLNIGIALTVEDLIIGLDLRGTYNGENRGEFLDYFNNQTEPMEHTGDAGILLGISYEYDAL